jgi:hypothetical protein
MKKTLIVILVPLILSGCGPEGKFPILECVFNNPDGSTTKMIYDLNEYAKKKASNDKNTRFHDVVNANEYQFQDIYPQGNNMDISSAVTVSKKTGSANLTITKPFRNDGDLAVSVNAYSKGTNYIGICEKVKNKKL